MSTFPIAGPGPSPGIAPATPSSSKTGPGGFGQTLANLVERTESSASDANDAVQRMLDGTGDVHEAMIALQRADLTLQLTVQVRNKLLSAYQEIMRMPV